MLLDDLFTDDRRDLAFAPDAVVLGGFALSQEAALLDGLRTVIAAAPWRYWETPGGFRMSAAKSNCGELGWVSNRKGYYYSATDPDNGKAWPMMPDVFFTLARDAAAAANFPNFAPDGCLLNQYAPGSKLSLHQDADEKDFGSPVVTISLGLTATFLFGGMQRSYRTQKIRLAHGDVVVWGGRSRLAFHGILPLKMGYHPIMGSERISVTFRKVA